MTDMVVCDTSLQMCRKSLYDHENKNEILSKGMVFNPMSEMKLFLQTMLSITIGRTLSLIWIRS
jgi:hypothetical protein